MDKKGARLRRARRGRAKGCVQERHRLSVFRTPKHIYAQIWSVDGGSVVVSASTVEKSVRAVVKYTGNKEGAVAVGELIAKRAQERGVEKVRFDRAGFRFHGRVKALADAAREHGLNF